MGKFFRTRGGCKNTGNPCSFGFLRLLRFERGAFTFLLLFNAFIFITLGALKYAYYIILTILFHNILSLQFFRHPKYHLSHRSCKAVFGFGFVFGVFFSVEASLSFDHSGGLIGFLRLRMRRKRCQFFWLTVKHGRLRGFFDYSPCDLHISI